MKKWIVFITIAIGIAGIGCAEKQFVINGLICPEGRTEDRIRADFTECRYYDLEAAAKASKAPITIECQKCLESKGYKIE